MKLTDLNPHWVVLEEGGPRVALRFDCPHCVQFRQDRIAALSRVDKNAGEFLRADLENPAIGDPPTRLVVCFHHHGKAAVEDGYILAHHGADDTQHIWDLQGQDDFATLTLSPSIDASKSGHWHGFIVQGEIR